MSRKPNTAERREQIVQALLRVMANRGYDGASIQAIAKEAGLSPGLIHYHFASKQEILLALVDRLVARGRVRFESGGSVVASARERLEAYVNARLGLGEGADPDAVAAWVVIGAEAVRQPEVRQVYQRVIQAQLALLTHLIVDMCAEAGRSADDAQALAATLSATMEGAFQLAAAAQDVMPRDYAARMVNVLVAAWLERR